MTPQELAEALVRDILPDSDVLGSLLRAGENAAVVLVSIEHAATHGKPVRPELLDAVQSALDDDVFDDVDAAELAEDLSALRPTAALR